MRNINLRRSGRAATTSAVSDSEVNNMPRPYRSQPSIIYQDRLKEIVILELHKNGGREYINMNLRQLYSYVMKAITTRPPPPPVPTQSSSSSSMFDTPVEETTATQDDDDNNETSTEQQQQQQQAETPLSPLVHSRTPFPSLPFATPPTSTTTMETNSTVEENNNSNDDDNNNNTNASSLRAAIKRPHYLKASFTQLPRVSFSQPETSSFVSHPRSSTSSSHHLPPHTYRERLGGYLHPRDMRRLITPFSSSNEPELMVRRHVMLLNFDPLRAIVLRDRLLVLVPDGADRILMEVEMRMRAGGVGGDVLFGEEGGEDEWGVKVEETEGDNMTTRTEKGMKRNETLTDDDDDDDDDKTDSDDNDTRSDKTNGTSSSSTSRCVEEWDDISGMKWINVPFELSAVDSILQSVCAMLSDESSSISTEASTLISNIRINDATKQNGISKQHHNPIKLSIIKDKIKDMEKRVQGFVRAVNMVLDEDEDMALMNLTRLITHPERFVQPVNPEILSEESDEPELILEAYLQQALSLVNALDLLKGQIVTTEEEVMMKLDTVRNQLLFINTVLSLVSLTVAIGSFVGSVFGMNLTNHLEESDLAFMHITVTLCVVLVFVLFVSVFAFRRVIQI